VERGEKAYLYMKAVGGAAFKKRRDSRTRESSPAVNVTEGSSEKKRVAPKNEWEKISLLKNGKRGARLKVKEEKKRADPPSK